MPRPKLERRITGRRPKRSDNAPSSGEKTNCMAAQIVPNRPNMRAADAVSPPRKLSTSFGSTGMTSPRASTSSTTVMRMNATAARRGRGPAAASPSDDVSGGGGGAASSAGGSVLIGGLARDGGNGGTGRCGDAPGIDPRGAAFYRPERDAST